jgi:DnaJ-class molecular chaperone
LNVQNQPPPNVPLREIVCPRCNGKGGRFVKLGSADCPNEGLGVGRVSLVRFEPTCAQCRGMGRMLVEDQPRIAGGASLDGYEVSR